MVEIIDDKVRFEIKAQRKSQRDQIEPWNLF